MLVIEAADRDREQPRSPAGPRRPRGGPGGPGVDVAAAEEAVRALLGALGADVGHEHLRDTPRRLAEACAELLTPRPFELTTFAHEEGVRQDGRTRQELLALARRGAE